MIGTVPGRIRRLVGLLFVAAIVVACAPTPVEEPDDPPEEPEVVDVDDLRERAEQALADGQTGEAIARYREIADAAERADVRVSARLRAAELLLEEGEPRDAAELLGRVNLDDLRGREAHRYRLAQARILLARGDAAGARGQLSRLPSPPPDLEITYHELSARVAEALERDFEAVRHRNELESHLERTGDRDANRQRLWEALGRVPFQSVRDALDEEPEDTRLEGWLELAILARTHRLDPERLEEELASWEDAFADHPALDRQVPELLTRYRERFQPPERIAVLLPLSSDFGDAARAVRNGLLAGFYANRGERPELTVHDTRGEAERTRELYLRLAAEGVDHVIGPLTKDELEKLAEEEELPTPVLALNTLRSDQEPPDGLYQFGLEPEMEARAAARHARASGWETVVALVPDTEWGQRVGEAFEEAFEEDDRGVLLERRRYDPDGSDFASPIRLVLNLHASDRRHRQLSELIGRSPEHLPRRRQDVDGVFIAAFPAQGRVLRPQLEYHHAQDLPVIATSHIYSGREDRDRDRDLNGVLFLDGPWMVDAGARVEESLQRMSLLELWGDDMERHGRLIALGIDAYRIVPYLDVLSEYEDESIDGLTGQLRVGDDGRIERQLVPAQFRGGRAVFQPARGGGGTTDH